MPCYSNIQGHAAFFGGGAYAAALLVHYVQTPMELALLLAPFQAVFPDGTECAAGGVRPDILSALSPADARSAPGAEEKVALSAPCNNGKRDINIALGQQRDGSGSEKCRRIRFVQRLCTDPSTQEIPFLRARKVVVDLSRVINGTIRCRSIGG